MPFCSNCGKEYRGGSKFCSSCGYKVAASPEPSAPTAATQAPIVPGLEAERVLWEGKPAGIGDRIKDAANVNSTTYTITSQRIIIKTGLLGKKFEEIELVRVKDVKVTQSLSERALGIGDIQVVSADETAPVMFLGEVRNPNEVKEILRSAVRAEKIAQGVKYREGV